MTEPIIRVENLGKKYKIKHKEGRQGYKALRDVLAESAKTVFNLFKPKSGTKSSSTEEFWALTDVSFEIQQGDVVGIIGRNGAGKSTLLKILSRITEPTTGRVTLKGRVASLLEVGTGFHPELTGRENIFLNGSILGMSRLEISRKFDEIVAFAEVEKFLDTPVKRYSSGMYVRLAFAVAAHLEPEILVVDEVLAVGDALFQKKCLGKMGEVAKGGRTVLLVSHNMPTIASLCQSVVLLKRGKIDSVSSSEIGIKRYQEVTDTEPESEKENPSHRRGTGEVRFVSVTSAKAQFLPAEPKVFKYQTESQTADPPNISYCAHLIDSTGRVVCQFDSRLKALETKSTHYHEGTFTIFHPWLKPGDYYLDFYIVPSHQLGDIIDCYEQACRFSISQILPYSHTALDTAISAGTVIGEFDWKT